ncbi:MCP four helix bundle domain-containing protein [Hydrogenovibrio halophilus]|uniref:MCP four helix bundle domain-containing protein n=1 Tax=Hydrogenovibrio halophilus TaxID=373391 RepID=UPI0003610BC4|nr:MCP four helix bundle domain-containing protein [Hydrogenovibrio halophilus]
MHLTQFLNHATNHTGTRLLVVMTLLLIALFVVIGNSLWQNQRLIQELEHITDERAQRIQLSTDLLEAAYNRHQSLINQLLTDDPFERDAIRQQFDKWGNRVGSIRRELRAHLDDPTELTMMAKQDALIPRIVELQNKVVTLLANEEVEPAQKIISQE